MKRLCRRCRWRRRPLRNPSLDGQECEDCVTLEDYQEYYKELVAQFGEGDGEGLGGRGVGEGGVAPEDEASKTGFKTEQSKSAVTAGKVLLSLQTKGLSDTGEAEENYAKSISDVKQGVSEAILQEQVPPGYHEEIKKYFDTLKPAPAQGRKATARKNDHGIASVVGGREKSPRIT